ncbi:hypothetical protein Tdes44962_MAKER06975 [Teratosphaeria destructans]|uniref:Uncharacterized protein n=1 Tax=Teratosphaeria destructans TaxID=418781 RepID=A0A9W7T0X5_9PEZI|nr:hypothetical protein Tdes44962_MAKER06975 [Teratosphaeria destructans]
MKTLPAELIELDEVTLRLVLLMPFAAVVGGIGWIVVARVFRSPVVRTASHGALESYVGQFWN